MTAAGRPTWSSSSVLISSPTAKSRMTTPISESTIAVSPGTTRPRAYGPTTKPPASSPITPGWRSRRNISSPTLAARSRMKSPTRMSRVSTDPVSGGGRARAARGIEGEGERRHRLDKVAKPDVGARDEQREQGHEAADPEELPEADRVARPGHRVRRDDVGGRPDDRGVAAETRPQRQRPPERLDGEAGWSRAAGRPGSSSRCTGCCRRTPTRSRSPRAGPASSRPGRRR